MRVIDSNKVSVGLLVLMGTQVAGALLGFAYGPLMGLSEKMELVFAGVWMLFTLVMCVGLAFVALGTEPPALAWGACVLELVSSVGSEVLQHATKLFGLSYQLVGFASGAVTLLGLAERALILWLLVSLLRGKHTWGPMVAVGLFGIGLARSAVPFAMSLGALDMEFYSSMLFGAVLTGATLLSTTGSLALTWFARKTTLEGEVSPVSPREAGLTSPVAAAPASPAADFAIGAVLLVIGLGVTAVSMSAASGGGRYVVATGAIGVGLGRVIRGFIKLGRGA